jgi:hypothetical protein
METWRWVWRDGVVPSLSDAGLRALETALAGDDPRLIQGATTSPPPLQRMQDWPVEGACALGYCGWAEIEAKLNGEPESVKPENAREIPLTQGKVAWVDPEDYETLVAFSWYAQEHHGHWYAHRTQYLGGGREHEQKETVPMHRQILSAPDGMMVDHKDRNGLNNTRGNLRLVTDAENKRNCKRSGKSIFRGVYPSPTPGKWCAKLSDGGKSVYLGTFDTEQAAASAYNRAAQERFGSQAVLNRFATVGEVEEFFSRVCFETDQRLGESAGCRWFLNAFDEMPRDDMRRLLLAEVRRSLSARGFPQKGVADHDD